MKRFYNSVSAGQQGQGFVVLLDGKPIRTPAKALLTVPTHALALAIAAEWAGQGQTIKPDTMPLMQLAATAIDQVGPQRVAVVQAVAAYAGSDLLCYRAEGPESLVRRQHAVWQPILDWVARRYDAPLLVVSGIMHRPQPPSALAALLRVIDGLDVYQLSGVQNAVGALGSLVLTLALLENRLDAQAAFEAAELDATYQIEQWGEDAEASKRRTALLRDIVATHQYLKLVKG